MLTHGVSPEFSTDGTGIPGQAGGLKFFLKHTHVWQLSVFYLRKQVSKWHFCEEMGRSGKKNILLNGLKIALKKILGNDNALSLNNAQVDRCLE
ncbi:MAG: hypothetical protein H7832_13170 [Magnetococcus sp. DMHC-6]